MRFLGSCEKMSASSGKVGASLVSSNHLYSYRGKVRSLSSKQNLACVSYIRNRVTSDEVGWVAEAVSSGAITKGFIRDGLSKDMESFFVDTWGLLPRVSHNHFVVLSLFVTNCFSQAPVSYLKAGIALSSSPNLTPINK